MKELIKRIPVVRTIARSFYRYFIYPFEPFPGSAEYWIQRYKDGRYSGAGSLNRLAEFKAEFLSSFIKEHNIDRVIEYGCGDGTQLQLAEYPSYLGFEISPAAIERCRKIFLYDKTKSFKLIDEYAGESAPLTISLDVIYHLIEDKVFIDYMQRLFSSSERFVIIYSSDTSVNRIIQAHHIKHRKFSEWVHDTKPHWKLVRHIPNRFPFKGDVNNESWSEFFVYEKILGWTR